MRSLPFALAAAALLVVPAAAAKRDRVPAAVPAGAVETCIPITSIRESKVRDDRTIDFIMKNGRVYRNVLPSSCPRLGFEQAFSYRTSLSRLCSVDIITVLDRAGPGLTQGAGCGLGTFQPVTIADERPGHRGRPPRGN
ncbi:hypothetical protein ABC347_05910 [Sphingomonas sp. 1P06PA]